MNGYGFTSCGYTGSNPGVGTTERFDDTANSHTSRANATARYSLAGYAFGGYGFTSCGYTSTYVGTTERFDDTANSHTTRANATARYSLAGYAFGGYGFTSCGYTSTYVGTTERFDDTANSHTARANATARRWLTGYAFNGYGFTSCGYTSTYVGTTERFDDTANSHTTRANATDRYALAGYAFGGYGFTSCGYTGSNPGVGTTERFDDTANSHTSRANATARYSLAGYAFGGYGFTSCGYTAAAVGTTERFDDTANSHTARANATARYSLAGYAFPNLDNLPISQSVATISSITLAWSFVREGVQDIQTEIYEGDVETNMSLLTTTSAGATSYTRSGLGQRVAKVYKTRWKWGSYTSSSYSSIIVGKTLSRLSIQDAQGGAGVKDASGNPIAGAKVFIKDALLGTLLGVATTDSSGKATFDADWPRMLSVDFEPQRDNAFTQVFADNFTTLSSNWVKLEGGGSASVVSDANASDGYALEANGYVRYEHNQNIQLDREALYRIRAKIRQVSDPTTGNKAIYVGITGVASDGTTRININGENSYYIQHYFAASGDTLSVSNTYTEFVGYFWYGGKPAGGKRPNRTNPGLLYPSIAYIRPLFILNHPNGDGVARIDYVIIEKVSSNEATVTSKHHIIL
jgi:hypothetical protein